MKPEVNIFSEPVLFVCSGNRLGECTAAISGQASALRKAGVPVSFFYVMGYGIKGYLRSALRLRNHLKSSSYKVVHAHYGLSAVVASLAGARPLVVSLMGSDVFSSFRIRVLIRFFAAFIWPVTIVKSEEMFRKLAVKKAVVIPNGVDFSLFREFSKDQAREKVGFSTKRHVLWPADPLRAVKNFDLANAAMHILHRNDCELSVLYGKTMEEMPAYYNASDVVLITSRWEGSPNVVKEALACNVPVVSTSVGDVEKWMVGVDGCKICESEPEALARGLEYALGFEGRSNGRFHIQELDNVVILEKILNIYKRSKNAASHQETKSE